MIKYYSRWIATALSKSLVLVTTLVALVVGFEPTSSATGTRSRARAQRAAETHLIRPFLEKIRGKIHEGSLRHVFRDTPGQFPGKTRTQAVHFAAATILELYRIVPTAKTHLLGRELKIDKDGERLNFHVSKNHHEYRRSNQPEPGITVSKLSGEGRSQRQNVLLSLSASEIAQLRVPQDAAESIERSSFMPEDITTGLNSYLREDARTIIQGAYGTQDMSISDMWDWNNPWVGRLASLGASSTFAHVDRSAARLFDALAPLHALVRFTRSTLNKHGYIGDTFAPPIATVRIGDATIEVYPSSLWTKHKSASPHDALKTDLAHPAGISPLHLTTILRAIRPTYDSKAAPDLIQAIAPPKMDQLTDAVQQAGLDFLAGIPEWIARYGKSDPGDLAADFL